MIVHIVYLFVCLFVPNVWDVKYISIWIKSSITSEALLWILCSCRSNDIQAILGICWTRVSRTQEARHWTTLFQVRVVTVPHTGVVKACHKCRGTGGMSCRDCSGKVIFTFVKKIIIIITVFIITSHGEVDYLKIFEETHGIPHRPSLPNNNHNFHKQN